MNGGVVSLGSVLVFLVSVMVLTGCGSRTAETGYELPVVDQGTVRFVVLGDAGEGNEDQYAVAAAMKSVCAVEGCDFALYLGDNFYSSGVESIDDEQWQTKFELPYAEIDFPFYAVLGNHDYGSGGAGNIWEQPEPQIAYSKQSDKWHMPDRTYRTDHEPVSFYGLDTNALMWDTVWGGAADQGAWLDRELKASSNLWKIAYGHHPYRSNGRHGNAGNYEGIQGVPVLSGETVQVFMEDHVCGQVDLYFAGHDHNLQWLEPTCGTEWVLSGAGSKLSEIEDRGNETRFTSDENEGFLWVQIVDRTLSAAFYDKNQTLLYKTTLTK
jgi:hypothetical protein